jgi:NTP pyrophosphatase (non-canonical NTP hydrolase)
MRVYADGLRWLDRYRENLAMGSSPLSDEDLVALAYAQGHGAGEELIASRFVGCGDLSRDEIWQHFREAQASAVEPVERPTVRSLTGYTGTLAMPRDQRQAMIASWAEMAFGREEATGIPQRGLRLLEEAIEVFQACGGDEAKAHKLVSFVFGRDKGQIGQELGGVAVCVLALAAAAGLSADQEEAREINRVLGKPISEFTARNAAKNAAGFKMPPHNPCCGNIGTHREGDRQYCSTCGQELL